MPDAPSLTWQWCRLDELTVSQQYAIWAAREAVFIVEQNCPYQDLDGLDLDAHHLVLWSGNAANPVAAYLRVIAPGAKFAEPSIGRVLTTQPFRGSGLGRQLMAQGVQQTGKLYSGQPIRISAQAHLDRFYGSFGFVVCSDIYLEDDIPHLEMLKP